MAGFDPQQVKIAQELASAPQYAQAGPKVRLAEAETAITESGVSRDPYENSEGSAGVLQQTPKDGWGTLQQVTNPRYASEKFLEKAIPLAGKYGTAGQLAQAVQRSAYPERYDEHSKEAAQLLQLLGGAAGVPGGPGGGNASKLTAMVGSSPGPSAAQTADLTQLLSSLIQPAPASSVAATALSRPASAGGPEAAPATAPRVPSALSPAQAQPNTAALLALVSQIGQDATPSSGPTTLTTPAASSPSSGAVPSSSKIPDARGGNGFTAGPGTNYSVNKTPEIAQKLNAMGEALGVKLTGISGYRTPQHSVAVGGFADDPHTKGLASDTEGTQAIPKAVLNKYGLERPFAGPKEADHIQLLHSVNANGGY